MITVSTAESLRLARRLAREEGIFCGISSGGNVAAALKLPRAAARSCRRIVTMVNDTGQRYFTTPLCGEAKHVRGARARASHGRAHGRNWTATRPHWEILA